jgi:hypothetical protein
MHGSKDLRHKDTYKLKKFSFCTRKNKINKKVPGFYSLMKFKLVICVPKPKSAYFLSESEFSGRGAAEA